MLKVLKYSLVFKFNNSNTYYELNYHMIVNNVLLLRITLQQALSSSFNTNGAWVGKGRTSGIRSMLRQGMF